MIIVKSAEVDVTNMYIDQVEYQQLLLYIFHVALNELK
jgi:hypothetical protein